MAFTFRNILINISYKIGFDWKRLRLVFVRSIKEIESIASNCITHFIHPVTNKCLWRQLLTNVQLRKWSFEEKSHNSFQWLLNTTQWCIQFQPCAYTARYIWHQQLNTEKKQKLYSECTFHLYSTYPPEQIKFKHKIGLPKSSSFIRLALYLSFSFCTNKI